MSDEVLSQAEVESLLSALDKNAPAAKEVAVPSAVPRTRDKVTVYDFKRPERVGKEQMRALQTLHEGFGRNFSAQLSTMLRTIVEVKLTSVDQLTYSEFVFSLENPTCFNLLVAEPLEGHLILDINPSILYPIIDRLLGGDHEQTLPARRPLTEIELGVVSHITRLFLKELRRAWENVLELDLSVVRVESNPQLVQIVPPNEVIILISFQLTLGEIRGMMNLCIPYNSIDRISNDLTANTWSSYTRHEATEEQASHLRHNLYGARVEVSADLAETTISTNDLISLRVGDIITTHMDVHAPLSIRVQGVPMFAARPGAYKGHKAIEIKSQLKAAG